MTNNTQNQFFFPIIGGAKVSSAYGTRKDPKTGVEKSMHYGIDFVAPIGTPVVATKSGTITRIGWENSENHSL